ncbi:MAG: pyrroline-5-carboxylate reductase [Candidatus Omnitrophota bacterium]
MRYLKSKALGVIGLGNMGCAILNGVMSSGAFNPPSRNSPPVRVGMDSEWNFARLAALASRRSRGKPRASARFSPQRSGRKESTGVNPWSFKKNTFFGFDVDAKKCRFAKKRFGVSILKSARETAACSDIILLAVKPQNMQAALREISIRADEKKLYISIAAGITTRNIETSLGGRPRVIRIMPNMPALIGEGISVVCGGRYANGGDLAAAGAIISSVGDAVRLDEKYFDLVTAVSGSGPAYFFYLIEGMIEAAIKMGLNKESAERLVHKTALGAAKLLINSKDDPKTLRMRVTSKGGTTAEAIGVFDRAGTKQIIAEAVRAAARRSKELSGG